MKYLNECPICKYIDLKFIYVNTNTLKGIYESIYKCSHCGYIMVLESKEICKEKDNYVNYNV